MRDLQALTQKTDKDLYFQNRVLRHFLLGPGLFLFFVLSFANPRGAFALFNISVRPYDGGNDLRFDRVREAGPHDAEAVIVSVQSDIARQYQVVQTLLDPLASSDGVLLPQENFTVYAELGSNAMGTLGAQQESTVSSGRAIVYTSSQQGDQDTFRLIYVIKDVSPSASGNYRGRVAYTLEPVGGAEAPVTVILSVYAEIVHEPAVAFKTESGTDVLRLSAGREEEAFANLMFSVEGKGAGAIRVSQALTEPLRSSSGETLAENVLSVAVSGAKNGDIPSQPFFLSSRSETVYSSAAGEEDAFVLTYRLAGADTQKAGVYRGRVSFESDISGAREPLGDAYLEIEIPRKFDLTVTPKLGGVIEFRNLKPQDGPQQSEVEIAIATNIGRPYQVSQKLLTPLTDREGREISEGHFRFKEESLATKGRLSFSELTPVQAGDMVLFVSDADGASDKFKVIYELTPDENMAAGDYAARIVYQISEL